jgi:hypothetical protein
MHWSRMTRPLGYWIKEIDRRIEADFERLLADEALTRRHWQVLTTLAELRAGTLPELDAALAPFTPTVRPQLNELIHRGWAAESPAATGPPARTLSPGRAESPGPVSGRPGGAIELTVAGRAAHERVAERVRAFRAQVTAGLSEQDYTTLVTLLERVAGNLTPA